MRSRRSFLLPAHSASIWARWRAFVPGNCCRTWPACESLTAATVSPLAASTLSSSTRLQMARRSFTRFTAACSSCALGWRTGDDDGSSPAATVSTAPIAPREPISSLCSAMGSRGRLAHGATGLRSLTHLRPDRNPGSTNLVQQAQHFADQSRITVGVGHQKLPRHVVEKVVEILGELAALGEIEASPQLRNQSHAAMQQLRLARDLATLNAAASGIQALAAA